MVANNTARGNAFGIYLQGDGNTISRNIVGGNEGEGIVVESFGNIISGNNVRNNGLGGIRLSDKGNVVSGNTVTQNGAEGIAVNDDLNLIDGNLVQDHSLDCALDIQGNANVYRNNMLRGNPGGKLCDSGTNNYDAGGNIINQ